MRNWGNDSQDGWVDTPEKDHCNICHSYVSPSDLYCRICGTKRGAGVFKPYRNIMQCIYGPRPVERTHVCTECGYSWTTEMMIDEEKHCPKCGASAPVKDGR